MTTRPDPPRLERIRPMLAKAGPLPPDDGGWALEMKWDGIRALAAVSHGEVRLISRSGQDVTIAYPELAGLGTALGGRRALLDGEVVVLGPGGWPDFEVLQRRIHIGSATVASALAQAVPVTYLAFDLLSLDGRELVAENYASRRARLEELALAGPRWQTPPSFTGVPGGQVLAVSQRHGLEGVVAKRLDSRYEPGKRSGAWVKIKNIRRQEAVVGGWRPGQAGRSGQIGSLLMGVYEAGGLAYIGHVGTGFTQAVLRMLGERLAPLRRESSPFAVPLPPEHARDAVWAEPELVIEVSFAGWTQAGRLRAPSYQGLRVDKPAAGVTREP